MMGGDSLDLDGFKAMMKKLKPETTAELAVEAFEVFRSSENTVCVGLSCVPLSLSLSIYLTHDTFTDELRKFHERYEKRIQTLGKGSV